MKYRAQQIKARWEQLRADHDSKGQSYRNFGRVGLEPFLEFCYTEYKELCHITGESQLSFGKWLTECI